jgi:hypothetical protein
MANEWREWERIPEAFRIRFDSSDSLAARL